VSVRWATGLGTPSPLRGTASRVAKGRDVHVSDAAPQRYLGQGAGDGLRGTTWATSSAPTREGRTRAHGGVRAGAQAGHRRGVLEELLRVFCRYDAGHGGEVKTSLHVPTDVH